MRRACDGGDAAFDLRHTAKASDAGSVLDLAAGADLFLSSCAEKVGKALCSVDFSASESAAADFHEAFRLCEGTVRVLDARHQLCLVPRGADSR